MFLHLAKHDVQLVHRKTKKCNLFLRIICPRQCANWPLTTSAPSYRRRRVLDLFPSLLNGRGTADLRDRPPKKPEQVGGWRRITCRCVFCFFSRYCYTQTFSSFFWSAWRRRASPRRLLARSRLHCRSDSRAHGLLLGHGACSSIVIRLSRGQKLTRRTAPLSLQRE